MLIHKNASGELQKIDLENVALKLEMEAIKPTKFPKRQKCMREMA